MNSLLLISPDTAWGFKPILSGKIRARVKQTQTAAEPSTMALCLRKK
ncbi:MULTISPECIES: hypothetical protein [unclassified Microcoleus]